MSKPRLNFVKIVTRELGEVFADEWLERSRDTGSITDAVSETELIEWPNDPDGGGDDLCVDIQNQIAQRVADQLRNTAVETFVRLANAVIEEERARPEEPLNPPRIETVETVTPEHGLIFAERMYRETADSEIFYMALSATHIMTWPDDGQDGKESPAQSYFHALTDEIRDRLLEETRPTIAEAFVRIAGDVTTRERRRR